MAVPHHTHGVWLAVAGTAIAVIAALFTWWSSSGPSRETLDASPERLLSRAEAAFDRNDLAMAGRILRQLLRAEPEHVRARLYLGQLLREQGDADRAAKTWRSITHGTADELATARFLEGSLAIERGRVDVSRRLLEAAIKANPDSLAARERLISVYRMLRKPADVVEQLSWIAERRRLSLDELVFLTIPQDSTFPPEETIRLLTACLQESPDDVDCRTALASALREANRPNDALAICDEVVSDQASPSLTAERVLALIDLEQPGEAQHSCDASSALVEKSHQLAFACGKATFETGDLVRAAELLGSVLEVDPHHFEATHLAGRLLARLNRQVEGTQLLDRAARLDELQRLCIRLTQSAASGDIPEDVLSRIATLLESLGRHGEAALWYEEIFARNPANLLFAEQARKARERARQSPDQAGVPPVLASPASSQPLRSRIPREQKGPLVTTAKPSRIRLVDVHESAGIDFQYFNGETGFQHLIESMGGGVLVIDFDGDGWSDLYFPQGCVLPYDSRNDKQTDRLFRNLGGGRFADVTHTSGLGSNQYGLGGAVFDCDNDGDEDLFVSNLGPNLFYRNEGDGTFSEISLELGMTESEMTTSVAAADFNGDGTLDLYLTNYVEGLRVCRNAKGEYSPCDPSLFAGQPDRLWLADESGGYRDESELAGIHRPLSRGLGVVTCDFDEDGRVDIYVANDGVPNFLFQNITEAGSKIVTFEDRGLISGTALDEHGRSQAGMGIALADFDGNRLPDLFVTNFYQEANTLYLNSGDLQFVDSSRESGLAVPSMNLLGFGTQAVDLDLDGDMDLFVANGHIQRDPTGVQPWTMPAQVFENLGGGRFRDVTDSVGPDIAIPRLGRGVAVSDLNRDGLPDIVMIAQHGPATLLENRCHSPGRSVTLRLTGTKSHRDARGSRLTVQSGDRRNVQWVNTNGGYLASNSPVVFAAVDSDIRQIYVDVLWPNGETTTHEINVAGQSEEWRLLESGHATILSGPGEPSSLPPETPDDRSLPGNERRQ